MRPILIDIGIPIYAYGASLTVAFLFGAWFGAKRARAQGLDGEHVWNVATWSFIAALLGSRAFHVAFENPALLKTPGKWLSIWQGGLVFYGGFIGAVLASIIYCRVKKLDFWRIADVVAPVIALGHGFVRIGCFLNGCCFGKPASWGVVFTAHDQIPRQPTQLYESAAGVLFFFGLLAYEKRFKKAHGELVALYAAIYGITRFMIEFVRADDRGRTFAGLHISQLIGLAGLVAGVAGFVWLRLRKSPVPSPPSPVGKK